MREASVHLTLKRAAQALGVHEQTLRAWEKRGLIRMIRLPGSRYRRVPVEEVERLKHEMTSTQEEEYRAFQAWRRSQTWREEQLAHLQSERAAFQRLLPELLKTHAGQFVAIHDGRVVDADADEGELAGRVIARGIEPVYIGEVLPKPRIYHVPSLEVIPHVSL